MKNALCDYIEPTRMMPHLCTSNESVESFLIQISSLETQNKELDAQLKTKTQQNKGLNQQMFQLQTKFSEIHNSYEQKNNYLTESIDKMQRINEELRSENELLHRQKNLIEQSLAQLKEYIETNEKRQKEQEKHFDQISKQQDKMITEITEDRDRLLEVISEKKNSEENTKNIQLALNSLRIQNQTLYDKNRELSSQSLRFEEENQKLHLQVETLSKNQIQNFDQISPNEEAIRKLKSIIDEDNVREAALELSLEKAEKTVKYLETEIKNQTKEIEILKSSAPSQLVMLQSQLEETKSANMKLNETISNMTTQITAIRQECNRLRKRLQTADQRNAVLTNVEQQNEKLQNRCDQLQKEKEQLQELHMSNKGYQNRVRELEENNEIQKKKIDSINQANNQLYRQNKALKNENEQLLRDKPEFDPETAEKVQKFISKLNRLQYELYYEEEGMLSEYTERQYRDIIMTLRQQLDETARIKFLLLKERNELKNSNIQLKEENKNLKLQLSKEQENKQWLADMRALQALVESLTKKVDENEAFKKKIFEKLKRIKTENESLKSQLSKSKAESARYLQKLADIVEQRP